MDMRMAAKWIAAFAIALAGVGCTTVRGTSRKLLGLDSTAGDADLEGDTFVRGVRAEGRFDRSDRDALAFAWSGSRISAHFSGTTAGVVLEDSGKNQFGVLIDGKIQPQKLVAKSGEHAYLLGAGLSPGEHDVALHRLTEANLGETKFLGFQFGKGGKLLSPGREPSRRIEVIGDSISTGYGNEGPDKTCHFSPETENHYLTYGAIAARAVGAELVTIAWSGKGVFSNRGSAVDTLVMPALWKRTLPERDDSRWNFADYQPDAVVVNLGSNDFAPEVADYSPFDGTYLAFIREVRAHYPKATIFCALGPALSDNWPEGRMALTRARHGVKGAVDVLHAAGDARIFFVEFPVQTGSNGYGCDWHPSLRTHELMGTELETELREKMGW
jgi:Carbohydrate esterase 2 N-terminal/GDSL-like Lipase/Acylhydrolase family